MRGPVRRRSGSAAGTVWESVTASADSALSGIACGYTEFREIAQQPIHRSEPASAAPVLIVEFDDPLLVTDATESQSPRSWQSFAAGPSQGPTSTRHAGAQHCIEVRLTPLGLYRLSGMAMSELNNRVVGLYDLLGRAGRELPERLAAETDWVQRFDLLDALFARFAAAGPEPDAEVAYTWHRLEQTSGTATIGGILTEIGWSRARLAKRFREQVGVPPKAAAGVLRFGRATELLTAPGHRSLESIASACGYYDQAHMNRDFRKLAGCTPMQWIAMQNGDVSSTRGTTDG